jgi:hypothetical protein
MFKGLLFSELRQSKPFLTAQSCLGKSQEKIILKHSIYSPEIWRSSDGTEVIEFRIDDSTISCSFDSGLEICETTLVWFDNDSTPVVLFSSNSLCDDET